MLSVVFPKKIWSANRGAAGEGFHESLRLSMLAIDRAILVELLALLVLFDNNEESFLN